MRWYEVIAARLMAYDKRRGLTPDSPDAKVRVIMDHLDPSVPYMIRHYLPGCGRDHSAFGVFLHKIMISDDDFLHDHPNDYISVILSGSYREHTPNGVYLRTPGHFRYRRAESPHRLEVVDGPVWTIFIAFRRRRDWGFFTPHGWIQHDVWLNHQRTQS